MPSRSLTGSAEKRRTGPMSSGRGGPSPTSPCPSMPFDSRGYTRHFLRVRGSRSGAWAGRPSAGEAPAPGNEAGSPETREDREAVPVCLNLPLTACNAARRFAEAYAARDRRILIGTAGGGGCARPPSVYALVGPHCRALCGESRQRARRARRLLWWGWGRKRRARLWKRSATAFYQQEGIGAYVSKTCTRTFIDRS